MEASPEKKPLTLTVIVAGTNDPSNSDVLADALIEGVKSRSPNARIHKIRLKDIVIEHFNVDCYGTSCPVDGLTQVESELLASDGVVIASPVWNFGVPAHLKNLIDRMGSFALDESRSVGTLNGKPFFMIFTAGMPRAAWPLLRKGVSHIPIAIQYFGGSVLGTHFEGGCTLGRGKFGLVVDKRPNSLQAVREKGMKFLEQVKNFKETGVLPLRYKLIKKFVRISQRIKKKLGL